eukprot:CAMPEP_0174968102 /NCGR_PEP_ID=MMETSP0004_2-20121128/7942_1 /TAXON_ID=420556 /ORGANISM="Ochromonas sp., Strain CCMP1393" /LENGTH=579 /DNA_ID=CAMNT_0016217287 /DNA_START=15 /DNA_END=1754 /DNA_ORIENTATION=+
MVGEQSVEGMAPSASEEHLHDALTKKRKNRWGSPKGEKQDTSGSYNGNSGAQENKEEPVKARKSRFGAPSDAPNVALPPAAPLPFAPAPGVICGGVPFVPGLPAGMTPESFQQTLVLNLQLQQVTGKLMTVVPDAAAAEQDPGRSPSPPPRYDSSGKRTNTREVRMREALTKERTRIIEGMLKLNPSFQAPADFVKAKPSKKIYMPKNNNPDFNYIGIIIGPRGNTQKQMEAETGTKISIRGKGSAKEGSKGRAGKNNDNDEELHVFISGEDEAGVEKACKMIEDLLRPEDEGLNEHKQKQLRELALINGTLREDEFCPVCGERGHRQFECPHRARSFKAAGVKCAICGDLSHPTRDCPQKNEGPTNEGMLDSEYNSFMAELGGGAPKPVPPINGSTSGINLGSLGEAGSGSGSSSSSGGGTTTAINTTGVRTGSGPTYVAPIVELVPSKKPQTVIHVTTVMTGEYPPVLASTLAQQSITGAGTSVAPSSVVPVPVPVQSSNAPNSAFPPLPPQSICTTYGVGTDVHTAAPPPPPPLPAGAGAGAGAGTEAGAAELPTERPTESTTSSSAMYYESNELD